MKTPRSLLLAALGAAAFAGVLGLPRPTSAQAPVAPVVPAANGPEAQLANEIANQHATIMDNQKAIDTKLAGITENLRIARAYISRGGGGSGASPK
jgi:hypothetical protein